MCMFMRSATRAQPVPSSFGKTRFFRSSNATWPDIRSLNRSERGSDDRAITVPLVLPECGEPDVNGDEQRDPDDIRHADREKEPAPHVADQVGDEHAHRRDALLEPRVLDERI